MVINSTLILKNLEKFYKLIGQNLSKKEKDHYIKKYYDRCWKLREKLDKLNLSERDRNKYWAKKMIEVNDILPIIKKHFGELVIQAYMELKKELNKQSNEIKYFLKIINSMKIPWVSLISLFDPELEKILFSGFIFTRHMYQLYLIPFSPQPIKDKKIILNLLESSLNDIGGSTKLSNLIPNYINRADTEIKQFYNAFTILMYNHQDSFLTFFDKGISVLDELCNSLKNFITHNFKIEDLI